MVVEKAKEFKEYEEREPGEAPAVERASLARPW
jgi:hypothetical protein